MKKMLTLGTLGVLMLGLLVSGQVFAASEKPIVLAKETQPQETSFVGNSQSKIYHEQGCWLAKKLKQDHSVSFSSPEEAQAAGYRPCKKCLKGQ